MKKLLLIILILLFCCLQVNCGELQIKYEQTNLKKYKIFKNHNVSDIIRQDLKKYKSGKKSIYGQLLYLYDNCDETSYDYLSQIQNNFKFCSQNTKCWSYIEVDNYRYNWLNKATKNIILFNNMIFLNK